LARLPAELKAIALILAVAGVAAGSVFVSTASSSRGAVAPTALPTVRPVRPTPIPAVINGRLEGLPTPRALALRRPVAVVLDNFYPDARPQSGIGAASVVFESLAEGGITRFMALYLERDAARVGPIRSARPYFVSWAAGYRALVVHAGGAPAALQLLFRTPALGNVEALLPRPEFSRSSDRVTPHNLYGSTTGARAIAQRNGWDSVGHFAWLPHRAPAPEKTRGKNASYAISFSTPSISSPPAYLVTYTYDRSRNVYLRSQGGQPFLDQSTRRQVAASNVVILFTNIHPIPGDPDGRISISTVGHGKAVILQNGHETTGTWSKPSDASPLRLRSTTGSVVPMNPGQTWIEVTVEGDLTRQPGQ
ncbi:MAG TPA: DUF3048 domain-containing protein, partial [Chloroflexota bacterium]